MRIASPATLRLLRRRRRLTDHDWDVATHYAMHGSIDHTAAHFARHRESVRRIVKRIAPQLLPGRAVGRRLGGSALRIATEKHWATENHWTRPAAAPVSA